MHPPGPDLAAFQWLPRPGCAIAALAPAGAKAPEPLLSQPLEGGATLVWLPLPLFKEARPALARLPPGSLPLFPATHDAIPAVLDAWLRLYDEAPAGLHEAVLQVVDQHEVIVHYLAAEEALWRLVYAIHPHSEGEGIYPHALAEAHWLAGLVLRDARYEAQAEFLTLAAFEAIARDLLVTVRRAEMLHLRDHLRGEPTVAGW